MDILFYGDPHGDFSKLHDAARSSAGLCVFLGDFGLKRDYETEIEPLLAAGMEVLHIHGNHDTETEAYHDRVMEGAAATRLISGKIVEWGGIRIAGLGGVFRGKIWNPNVGQGVPVFRTRKEFLSMRPSEAWRGGVSLKQRSSIFPEDFDALRDAGKADVLVAHEAPSNHKFGFQVIDELANDLGARVIVHGHHHRDYEDILDNGIRVVGVGKANYRILNIEHGGLQT